MMAITRAWAQGIYLGDARYIQDPDYRHALGAEDMDDEGPIVRLYDQSAIAVRDWYAMEVLCFDCGFCAFGARLRTWQSVSSII